MVKRKTRLLSAFAAVLMLVSLFACFVLPVTAAEPVVNPISDFDKLVAAGTVDGGEAWSVSSVEELEALSDARTKTDASSNYYLNRSSVVYITEDIDLSEYTGTKATDLTGLYAKLNGDLDGDGVGVTISGLTLSGKAWLGNYKGTEIKNLNFEDCSNNGTAERSGLLIDLYSSNGLKVENVTFKSCSNTAAKASLVVGDVTSGALTFKNVDILNCTITPVDAEDAFLVGRANYSTATTITVDTVYMNGNTFGKTNSNTSALVSNVNNANTTLVYKNIGIFNTKVANGTRYGFLAGTNKGTVSTLENVMVAGFEGGGKYSSFFPSGETAEAKNCYATIPVIQSGTANGNAAAIASGEAAYTLNAAGVSQKWAMNGTTPVFSDDKYTVKVVVGENVSYVNIGGTLTLEEGYEYSVDADYATVAGNVLTVKAAPADLVISVTATEKKEVYPISDFAAMETAGTLKTGLSWTVSSKEELEALSDARTKTDASSNYYLNRSSVVYITEDIDLSEYTGTKATDLTGLYAKLNGDLDGDGVGVTISGLTLSGKAWLGDYKGIEIKNLNFENCSKTSIKATAECSGLLIDVYESNGLTVENVTFKNCSNKVVLDNDTARTSLVIGQVTKGNVTFKNIDIQGSTLKTGAANNAFLVGEVDVTAATTITVDTVYLNDNTYENSTTNTSALISNLTTAAVGKTTLSFKNVGIFNTTFNGKNRDGALCGKAGVTVAAVENVMVAGFSKGSFTSMFLSGTTATATNCYSAIPVVNGGTANGTEAAVASGEAAWTLNAAGVSQKWAMDGTTPIFDTAETSEPVAVTCVATIDDDDKTYTKYTDKDGKLIYDDAFAALGWSEADLTATYTEPATITVVHEHSYDENGVVTAEPTCGAKGVKTFTCACGATKTEAIPATGKHTVEEWTTVTEPTVDEKGSATGKCTVCGADCTKDLDPAAGLKLETVIDEEGAAAVKVNLANNPGLAGVTLTLTYKLDALTLGTVEAGELGFTVNEQPVIDEEKGTATVKLSAANAEDISANGLLATLNFTAAAGKEDYTVAVSAEGYTAANVPVALLGADADLADAAPEDHTHDYAAVVTAPTCEAAGYTTYTCSGCGDTYKDNDVPAKGHDMKETAAAVAPTCTEAGKTAVLTCANGCGKTEGGEEIAATGHDMKETTAAVAPGCETAGATAIYTCANGCGKTEGGEEIAATGHDMKETTAAVAPGCETPGATAIYTCANGCGKTEGGEEIAATGHDMKETAAAVAPTCTEAGKTAVLTCANGCGKTEGGEEIAALGHTKGEAVRENVVDATYNEAGSYDEVVYCTVCKAEISREKKEIPVLGGAEAEIDGVKYGTLEEAAAVGGNIILRNNVELGDDGVTFTKDATLDLNGMTITSTGEVFVVTAGTLTINGDGTITGNTDKNGDGSAVWANGGHVIINGGTYSTGKDITDGTDHSNDTIYTKNGGTVVINGGTFIATEKVWLINENDANRGTITVNGGEFRGFNPMNNVSEGAGTNFVAEGKHAVDAEGNEIYTIGEHIKVEIPAVDATCTVAGSTAGVKCSVCDMVLEAPSVITATGHDMQETAAAVAPTCTEAGKTATYTCANGCGEIEGGEEIAATGHTPGEGASCTEAQTCTVCGAELEAASGHYGLTLDGDKVDCANCDEKITGMYEIDGNIYYAKNGTIVKDDTVWVANPVDGYAKGNYAFGPDGILANDELGTWLNYDGLHYFVNGKPNAAGVIELNGKIYYINSAGKVVYGQVYISASKLNDKLPKAGQYLFDSETGILADKIFHTWNGYDGLHYIEQGKPCAAGVINLDGKIYYIKSSGKVAYGSAYVSSNVANGELKVGTHTFDAATGVHSDECACGK